VLVLPPFACPTREVYRAFDVVGPTPRPLGSSVNTSRTPFNRMDLFNDLTSAAHQVCPDLARLHTRLQQALPDQVRMTGSGSTLFILTDDPVAIAAAGNAAPEAAILRTRLI
jgi:4-diphosphocytidyl-2C-methyl-D-erythritol kinase